MKRVLLGLGSNRKFNDYSCEELLKKACNELSLILKDMRVSSIYKTKAMYVEDQDDFYNMAALGFVDDDLNPFDLLKKINNIESKYGRNRKNEIRYGPRSLDIDIELFGDDSINDPILIVPHEKMEERAFVLIPSLEILDDSADKKLKNRYTQLLKNNKDAAVIKKVNSLWAGQLWNK